MSFDLQVVRSIDEISQEAWDHLVEGRPFASYQWFRFGETVLTHDMPFYIVLSRGSEPVACGAFRLTGQEPLPISSRPVRYLMEAVIRRWPLLMCQSPLASVSGLMLPDPSLRDAAVEAIAQAALEIARRNQASFVLFPHLEPHETQWSGWPSGYVATEVPGSGTRLSIAWPDFESYVKHLSKSARKDYRRQRNRATDLGVVVETHHEVTGIEQAMVLIRNVERHHGSPPNPWARSMLEHASLVDAIWLTAEVEGCMVGCGLLLGEGDSRFLALLGLDYDMRYAYFQLVYAAIRCAVEEGVKILRGGSGAYDLKQRLGFRVENNNHVVFAGRGTLLQQLGRWAAGVS